jgi:hypothetical protein
MATLTTNLNSFIIGAQGEPGNHSMSSVSRCW